MFEFLRLKTFIFSTANERQIFSLVRDGIKPDFIFDGMTSDRDSGNLYLATFGGSKIVKFNPRYEIELFMILDTKFLSELK